MKETAEKKHVRPVHGFLFASGMLLTPDEMRVVERYGFLFSNDMLLTPNEAKILENLRVVHATKS